MENLNEINKLKLELDEAKQEIDNLKKEIKNLQKFEKIKENSFNFQPIGKINSSFPRIRGTPRQATITKNTIIAKLTLNSTTFTNPSHSLQDLIQYSHLWIIFIFHEHQKTHRKAKISPPRLDGLKTGLFASRSPHRPCPIGLSLVKLQRIEGNSIFFYGVDMVDQSPVLDIKPYIPNYDKPENDEIIKLPRWIDEEPAVHSLNVRFADGIINNNNISKLTEKLIENILTEDPRSTYLRQKGNIINNYECRIDNLLIKCVFNNDNHTVTVKELTEIII